VGRSTFQGNPLSTPDVLGSMNKLYAALVAAAIAVPGAVVLAAPASADQDVYYKNCDAVRAAGKDPLYRGDPGYRPALDRDNDGIACEPRGGSKKRDDGDSKGDDSGSDDKDSTTTRETTESTSRSDSSSNRRSYGQIGEDDVPAGGVATGGG